MLSEERLKEIESDCANWSLDSGFIRNNCEELLTEIEKCHKVIGASGALVGDFMHDDEEPTHYTSWIHLKETLAEWKKP